MQSEFHQFINLPTELRLQIWKRALRPISSARPGAHFFSVTDFKGDGAMLKKLRIQCDMGSECETEHNFYHSLAAPKFSSSHSWTSNNTSAYLWDFGMWTACHESREIIEKHYKIEYWATKLRQDKPLGLVDHCHYRVADACVPFIHPRSGEDWCFTIHPNRDLICLQPITENNTSFHNYYQYFLGDVCMVDLGNGLNGFVNLALEYNSSWYDGIEQIKDPYDLFEERSPRGIFVRAITRLDEGYPYDRTLWLIDSSLKRGKDEGVNIASRKRKVFNGFSQQFVEVGLDSHDYSDTWSRSALDFVAQLDMLFGGISPKYSCLSGWGVEGSEVSSNYYIGLHVQVLACEGST